MVFTRTARKPCVSVPTVGTMPLLIVARHMAASIHASAHVCPPPPTPAPLLRARRCQPRCGAAQRPTAGVQALVVAPTRELAAQIQAVTNAIGRSWCPQVACHVVIGGLPLDDDIRKLRRCAPLSPAAPSPCELGACHSRDSGKPLIFPLGGQPSQLPPPPLLTAFPPGPPLPPGHPVSRQMRMPLNSPASAGPLLKSPSRHPHPPPLKVPLLQGRRRSRRRSPHAAGAAPSAPSSSSSCFSADAWRP